MSIMEAFRNIITGGPQNNQPTGQGNLPNPNDPSKNNPNVPGNKTVVPDGTGPGAFPKVEATGEKSPLDGFKDLWEIDPKQAPPASLVPTINADPKKLMEAARGVDFTKAISPATAALIAKGDVNGFMAGLNEVAQAAFAHSAGMTSNLVTAALTQQEKTFHEKVLPEALRKHEASTALRADNPLFNDPAVTPMINMLETQFAAKYPNAPASEISASAKGFVTAFAEAILKQSGKTITDPPAAGKKGDPAERPVTDWADYFGVSP